MQIKFPELPGFLVDLEKFEPSFSHHTLVDPKTDPQKFKRFSRQLQKTHRLTYPQVEKVDPGALLQTLTGRCHHLKIRSKVVQLTKDAAELANRDPSEDICSDATSLRERIDRFLDQHRLSREHTLSIRRALKLIELAQTKKRPLIRSSRIKGKIVPLEPHRCHKVTRESYEVAESLYELAGLVYENKTEKFLVTLSNEFSPDMQREIIFHIGQCDGSLKKLSSKEHQYAVIRGIIWLAHLLCDHHTGTPCPSVEEVRQMFEELAKLKSEENQTISTSNIVF